MEKNTRESCIANNFQRLHNSAPQNMFQNFRAYWKAFPTKRASCKETRKKL